MTGFDPGQATAAYLAQLPSDVRDAAARHTEAAHWLWLAHYAGLLAVCWLLARLDVMGRLERRIEAKRPHPWGAAAACGVVLALIAIALSMAIEAVGAAVWRQTRAVPYGLWLIAAVFVLPVLYAAARQSVRRWWLWSGATLATLAVLLVWVPFAAASGPAALPAAKGPVADGVLALARDAGLPVQAVYVSPAKAVDADVTGAPGRPRIVVTQGMLDTDTPSQARAAVGHLIGHYAHQDQLALALALAAMAFALFFAVDRLFAPVSRQFGLGGAVVADPAGLPVAVAIGAVVFALGGVAYGNLDRVINLRADRYSLDHAREPDGLAQALLRSDTADKADPSPLEEVVFYDHPALKGRIARAMAWKAADLAQKR